MQDARQDGLADVRRRVRPNARHKAKLARTSRYAASLSCTRINEQPLGRSHAIEFMLRPHITSVRSTTGESRPDGRETGRRCSAGLSTNSRLPNVCLYSQMSGDDGRLFERRLWLRRSKKAVGKVSQQKSPPVEPASLLRFVRYRRRVRSDEGSMLRSGRRRRRTPRPTR